MKELLNELNIKNKMIITLQEELKSSLIEANSLKETIRRKDEEIRKLKKRNKKYKRECLKLKK